MHIHSNLKETSVEQFGLLRSEFGSQGTAFHFVLQVEEYSKVVRIFLGLGQQFGLPQLSSSDLSTELLGELCEQNLRPSQHFLRPSVPKMLSWESAVESQREVTTVGRQCSMRCGQLRLPGDGGSRLHDNSDTSFLRETCSILLNVYIYIYIYTYSYIHMYIYIYVCMYVCIYISLHLISYSFTLIHLTTS